jgi:hypothetical protein
MKPAAPHRIFLDTNVYIIGAGDSNIPERLFEKCLALKPRLRKQSPPTGLPKTSVLQPAAAGFVSVAATSVAKATSTKTFKAASEAAVLYWISNQASSLLFKSSSPPFYK